MSARGTQLRRADPLLRRARRPAARVILRACTLCGRLSDQRRCERHRPVDDRPSASARGYDGRWQRLQARYLAAHPICECDDCLELPAEQRPAATDVDHRDASGPFGDNSDGNLCAMAHGHHSRKTVLFDGGFGRSRASSQRGTSSPAKKR